MKVLTRGAGVEGVGAKGAMGFRAQLIMTSAVLLFAPEALAQNTNPPAQQPAAVQQDEGLDDIVVTAQRRAQSLQDVPIAISAFTEEEMLRRNIGEALDVVQYVPNFIGHNNTGLATANTYYIRGVGDTESLASKDPPVGTYIDDIFFARQSANNFALFDVERIEVLRGPQGTLFGRNTTGGAVNVFLRRPGDDFGGYLEVGAGSFDRRSVRASVDLPLSESFRTKLSGYFNEDEGYVTNITTGETLNGETNYGGRIGLEATLSPTATWTGFGIYMHAAGSNLINFSSPPNSAANVLRSPEGGDRFASTGLRINNGGANQYPTLTIANGKGNHPLGNETDTYIFGSNLEFELGDHTLNFITGFVDSDQSYNLDFFDGRAAPSFSFVVDPATGRPTSYGISSNVSAGGLAVGRAGGFAIAALAETEQFTQEIKLTGDLFGDRLSYVAGVYYFQETNVSDFADIVTSATTGVATLLADRVLTNETEAWAIYGQADFRFTDRLTLTAGLRYTDEEKAYSFADNRPACQVTPLPANCIDNRNFEAVDIDLNPATPPVRIPRTSNEQIWTPRFAINFDVTEDLLLFASATRGFKSGGQSARSTSVRFLLPFGPETVWSYEAGFRSEWDDGRYRLNATAFYADTQDLQGGSAFVTTNLTTGAQTLSFVTRNFADFENQGLEIEFSAIPLPGLNLTASVGLQDAVYVLDAGRVDEYGTLSTTAQLAECRAALAGQVSPRGDTRTATARAQSSCGNGVVTPTGELAEPPRTPDLTFAGSVSYEWSLPGTGMFLTPSLNAVYVSDQEVGTSNTSFYQNAAGVLNVNGDGRFITGSFSEAHWVFNAGLTLRPDDERWSASIECSNCSDEAFPQSTLSNFSYLNTPATWQVRFRARFGP
jgi:iron complex outermembrane receptor protein